MTVLSSTRVGMMTGVVYVSELKKRNSERDYVYLETEYYYMSLCVLIYIYIYVFLFLILYDHLTNFTLHT